MTNITRYCSGRNAITPKSLLQSYQVNACQYSVYFKRYPTFTDMVNFNYYLADTKEVSPNPLSMYRYTYYTTQIYQVPCLVCQINRLHGLLCKNEINLKHISCSRLEKRIWILHWFLLPEGSFKFIHGLMHSKTLQKY